MKKKFLLTWFQKIAPTLLLMLVLIVFFVVLFINDILHIIYPGHAGVKWSIFHGTQVNYVYPEGFHLTWPANKMYIYDVRIQEISKELDVLSKKGLRVHLLFSIRFRPKYEYLGLLHQNIGMDYPDKVILPEIESVLRETIGTLNSDEIYTSGRKIIAGAINQAIEQLHQRYILVDDVLIRKIILPEIVANAIKFKIEQKHLVDAHEYIVQKEEKEARRKYVEAEGIKKKYQVILQALQDEKILKWEGIQATKDISKSENAKVLIIGGKDGLPIIFNSSQ